MQGCDYAFSHPSETGLYAAGMRFAIRYVGPGTDDKQLHSDERDRIWAAGMSIGLVAEGTASGALGGFPTGQAHASSAWSAAQALGAPNTIPIYFAVDFDVTAAQWSTVASYLDGAASVIGVHRVGIYGGLRAVQWAARDQVAFWFWQTYAWSGGLWYSGNHLEQYQNNVTVAGGQVDLCRSKAINFGQWEGDMALTPEDAKVVWDYILSSPSLNYSQPVGEWMKWTYANGLTLSAQGAQISEIQAQLQEIKALLQAGGGGGGVGAHSHDFTGAIGDVIPEP